MITNEIEEQYPECTNELLDNFQKAYKLWCAKQHDYGDSNIRLGLDLSPPHPRVRKIIGLPSLVF